MRRTALPWLLLIAVAAGCSRPDTAATPLPTREGTIGRVQEGLEQADKDAARRREQVERSTQGRSEDAQDPPTKSMSSMY